MITFCISLGLLVLGYVIYGRIIERIFGANANNKTPALRLQDGVDYIPMKPWRIFLIQFLNIAGVGPIFGAIMGAAFGSSSFLWIVFGSIFAGGVHDYLAGIISLRHNGTSLPEIHGLYLGKIVKNIMRVFMLVLLILVGAVFVSAPANLLAAITSSSATIWIAIIFAYYLIATLLPIDKIIGRIYPLFGISLLIMVFGIMISLFYYHVSIPEIWDGLQNTHPKADAMPIFPMLFVTIACGAISGFHATQSPLMARCMTNERYARPIFYGSMITEGIVALVWAAAATYFFHNPAFNHSMTPAEIVNFLCQSWMGPVGAILAMLGVVAAPITSGDTALRSARLIFADMVHYDQKPIRNRLFVTLPLFVMSFLILLFSLYNADGFDIIWRYFAWCNQVLATVTLWAISVYLRRKKKCYFVSLIPALFMTMVCCSYILITHDGGFGLSPYLAYSIAGIISTIFLCTFYKMVKQKNDQF